MDSTARQFPSKGCGDYVDGLVSKRLLPTLRDVRAFMETHGMPRTSATSRERVIPSVLHFLVGLPTEDIARAAVCRGCKSRIGLPSMARRIGDDAGLGARLTSFALGPADANQLTLQWIKQPFCWHITCHIISVCWHVWAESFMLSRGVCWNH